MKSFILASSSPRRRDLLAELSISFRVVAPDLDETIFDHLPVRQRVQKLAEAKAVSVTSLPEAAGARWILGADTLVHLESRLVTGQDEDLVLGKPLDAGEARRMIALLSGREHFVHTGIVLLDLESDRLFSALSESRVHFATLSSDELDMYARSGDWEGVAGGYKIQGVAARHIDKIEGSWSGIVGLPIRELYVILQQSGFPIGQAKS